MPQTADTFTNPVVIQGPNLPGGVSVDFVCFSFGGTAATYNVISPANNVVAVHVEGNPLQLATATVLDRLTVNNTRNVSGNLTLIAASTRGSDVQTPTIIQLARTGTNNQDACVTVYSKGG